jgi:hypothetical protein
MERVLATAQRRATSAQRFAFVAVGVAMAACCASAWITTRAGALETRSSRNEQELQTLRADLDRVAADRGRAWKLASAALSSQGEPDADPAPGDGDASPALARASELDALRADLRDARVDVAELEREMLDWGQEAKRYVDQRVAAADTAHRQERADELRLVVERLRDLESR